MKFFLTKTILFFALTFIASPNLLAKELSTSYKIKIGSIAFGNLKWIINLEENIYNTSIVLKNEGLFSNLYSFNGKYSSEGKILNGELISHKYTQFWETKKKKREIRIIFNKTMISSLSQNPKEKEESRINYLIIRGLADPLTSFINILLNNNSEFKTIDGRRLYKMSINYTENKQNIVSTKITIHDYLNIWTDHNRKDLKFIITKQNLSKKDSVFPHIIKIKNKGLVFNLTKI